MSLPHMNPSAEQSLAMQPLFPEHFPADPQADGVPVLSLLSKPIDIALPGCTPEPLLSYLQALGVLRLVATQADSHACGYWQDDIFHLVSRLDRDLLGKFFLECYRPAPLLNPWNNAGGFLDDGDSEPARAVERVASSPDPRLNDYKQAIVAARRVVAMTPTHDKSSIVRGCRNTFPDSAVLWLDAAVVLTDEKPHYPPLLGTGGNDGRLEFTINYMQRLVDLLPSAFGVAIEGKRGATRAELPGQWLRGALFGEASGPLVQAAVGQFDPAGSGGPNATAGFEAGFLVNPWSFVLALDGLQLFSAAAVRRMASGSASGSAPFTVRASAVGYASAGEGDQKKSRAEVWLPLWDRPTGLAELAFVFNEGRATLGRKPARNGVDMARAIASLGVDRGISAFTRYGLLQRSGKAYLATPLGRLRPHDTPVHGTALVAELDVWLESFRRVATAGSRYATALHRVDAALFAFAASSDGPQGDDAEQRGRLLGVLRAVGSASRAAAGLAAQHLGRGTINEMFCPPLHGLTATWLDLLPDTIEVRLAAALAGVDGNDEGKAPTSVGSLRANLEQATKKGQRWVWNDALSRHTVWSETAPLPANLAAILMRRSLDASQHGVDPSCSVRSSRAVDLADALAFLRGDCDDEMVADLLWAMCGMSFLGKTPRHGPPAPTLYVPRSYALLKLFFTARRPADVFGGVTASQGISPTMPPLSYPGLLPLLQAQRVDDAVKMAAQRLKVAGCTPLSDEYHLPTDLTPRLPAALFLPLSDAAVWTCADRVIKKNDAEKEEDTR